MSAIGGSLPTSYHENFLEVSAQIISKFLTDEETDRILLHVRSFHEKIKSVSSQNLRRLNSDPKIPVKDRTTLCQHGKKTCTQNCTRGFLKTFIVAFSVKYCISILPALLSGKILKKPGILKQMAGKDTLFFSLFLGTFISGYKGILCAMRHFRNTTDKESDRLNAFVAGSLAGLALILDRDKSRRRSIMLYLLTRALQFNGAWMMKKWDVKRRQDHPGQVKWDDRLAWFLRQFSGAGVMMLVSSQVIYALLFCPDTLPKSYFSFLLIQSSFKSKFGRKAPDMARLIGTSVNNIEKGTLVNKIPAGITSREFIAKFVSESASELVPPNLKHDYTICAIHHPATESCISDKAFTFREEFLRALNLYVPLNVIMLLAFRLKKLRTDPTTVSIQFVKSCLRSALFLTTYVVVGITVPCLLRRWITRDPRLIYFLNGLAAGAAVLIEAPGRQLELALYVFPRALESLWKLFAKKGYVRNVPHSDILLFMASMGSLMTLYQNEQDTINSHYLSVMTRFFGQN